MLADYYAGKSAYEKVSRARLDAVRALLPAKRPLAVLDVGCGTGTLGEALKKDGGIEVFGIDVAPKAVEAAKTRLGSAWVVDIESAAEWPPEIAGRRYDAIVLSEVLEHLFAPEQLLRRLRALLADGGSLVITVPNVLFWKNRLRIFAGHFEYEDSGLMDRGHIHFFSWQSFRDLLAAEGYRIDDARHVAPTRALRFLRNALPGLAAKQFAVRALPV